MDLFEKIKDLLGCEYISDIRNDRWRNTTKNIIAKIDLSSYSALELADMAEYLYGVDMYGSDKDTVINFLKNAPREKLSIT